MSRVYSVCSYTGYVSDPDDLRGEDICAEAPECDACGSRACEGPVGESPVLCCACISADAARNAGRPIDRDDWCDGCVALEATERRAG